LALILAITAMPAMATIYNVPIDVTGTFYGGSSLTGVFSINSLGYANSTFSFSFGAGTSVNGTAIAANTISSAGGAVPIEVTGEPNTYEILAQSGSTNDALYITFLDPLNQPGIDPFKIDADSFISTPDSAQCAGYSCTSSDERLLASGDAYVDPPASVPEPWTLALFGAGLLGLGVIVRRRKMKSASIHIS